MVHRRQQPTMARLTALAVLLAIVSMAPADESAVRAEVDALILRLKPTQAQLVKSLGDVAQLHNRIKDRSGRAMLRMAIGKILDATDSAEVFQEALDALVALDDPKAAFSRMREHLPAKDKKLTNRGKAVLSTLARNPIDAAVSPLQRLATKAYSAEVRAAAIVTLGGFGASSRRVSVAKFLLTQLSKLNPGQSQPLQGPWLTEWYRTGPALLDALQRLTGKKHPHPGTWLAAYERDKKNLEALLDPAHSLPAAKPTTAPWKAMRAQLRQHGLRAAVNVSIERALRWLAAHQSKDGSFRANTFADHCKAGSHEAGRGRKACDVGVTGLALNAFLVAGYDGTGEHDFDKAVKRGLAWIMSTQREDGLFGSPDKNEWGHVHYRWEDPGPARRGQIRIRRPIRLMIHGGHAHPYNHAIATLALIEASGLTENPEYTQRAQRGIDYIHRARNPYLAWRYGVRSGENDTSVTAWMTMTLSCARMVNGASLRAGRAPLFRVDGRSLDGAKQWFDKMTDREWGQVGYLRANGSATRSGKDGGVLWDRFPSEKSQAMTAASMCARLLMGETPARNMIIQKGAALCLEVTPTWNSQDGSIDMIFWHFGTLALHTVGGTARRKWEPELHKALLPNQHRCGAECCQLGSWEPIGAWGGEGGTVYATALNALTLLTPRRFPALAR